MSLPGARLAETCLSFGNVLTWLAACIVPPKKGCEDSLEPAAPESPEKVGGDSAAHQRQAPQQIGALLHKRVSEKKQRQDHEDRRNGGVAPGAVGTRERGFPPPQDENPRCDQRIEDPFGKDRLGVERPILTAQRKQ